jgi:hypothetical protein
MAITPEERAVAVAAVDGALLLTTRVRHLVEEGIPLGDSLILKCLEVTDTLCEINSHLLEHVPTK